MEDNIKTAAEVARRHTVTAIMDETIENVFTVGYEQKEGIKTLIKNMVERALIDIVEQVGQNTVSMHKVDRLTKSTCIMDALTR